MKAVQTRYKGFYFRSRLEARYAVLFDSLGIHWWYEKWNYGFVGFRVFPAVKPDYWVVVKPRWPIDPVDLIPLERATRLGGTAAWFFVGVPEEGMAVDAAGVVDVLAGQGLFQSTPMLACVGELSAERAQASLEAAENHVFGKGART